MSDEQSIRDEIADEIAGVVTGEGYYSTTIGIDAAQEAADAIMPLVRRIQAEAWDRCVGEMPIDPDWKNFYGDNNPYREGAP